jgi:hypothetical protein
MTTAPPPDIDDDGMPWEEVDAARADARLQRRHGKRSARRLYESSAERCPQCGAPAAEHAWFYFQSSVETWRSLHCGRAGWMTVCDTCHRQVNFFLEAMS